MKLCRGTWPRVFDLAWPVIATGSVRTTMRTVDLLVLGIYLGPPAIAAIGLADLLARLVEQTARGLGAGTTALVSQNYGAGDRRYANAVTTQTVLIGLLLGGVAAAVGLWAAPHLFALLGATAQVTDYGVTYLGVVLLSMPFRFSSPMAGRALQAAGDTRTPMVLRVITTATNIVLTVVLVPGLGPFPALGVVGAAAGTALGNTLTGLGYAAILASGRFVVRFTVAAPDGTGIVREFFRLGIPKSIQQNTFTAAEVPLNAMILVFGTDANAAFHVARRIQQYVRMPNWGFRTASSTLVGNHLGRGEVNESVRYGWGSVTLGVAVTVVVAAFVTVFADPIGGVFTDDPGTRLWMAEWIPVLAGVAVFNSFFSVTSGILTGGGDTRWPLFASLVGIGVGMLCCSYVVGIALGVGIVGIYLGIALDFVIRSGLLYYRFRTGAWRTDVTGGVGAD